MSTVIPAEDLSTEVVQNLFRSPIQAEADDQGAPLTDPREGKRDASDPEIPPFVLPSFPDQDPLYPHVLVSEADHDGARPDPARGIVEGDYDVEIGILARSTTQLNKITDGVRHWFVDQYDTLVANGFTNPRLVGGGAVPTFERDPSVEQRTMVYRGTVYTE